MYLHLMPFLATLLSREIKEPRWGRFDDSLKELRVAKRCVGTLPQKCPHIARVLIRSCIHSAASASNYTASGAYESVAPSRLRLDTSKRTYSAVLSGQRKLFKEDNAVFTSSEVLKLYEQTITSKCDHLPTFTNLTLRRSYRHCKVGSSWSQVGSRNY